MHSNSRNPPLANHNSHYKQSRHRISNREYLHPRKDYQIQQNLFAKKKISKVQSLIKQAQHFLAEPFPNVNFLMLTSFSEMTELQRSELNVQFREYLSQKMEQLPSMIQQISPKEQQDEQQQQSNKADSEWTEIIQWVRPPVRDIQRQLPGLSNSYLQNCKQLKPIYLKIIQTDDLIHY